MNRAVLEACLPCVIALAISLIVSLAGSYGPAFVFVAFLAGLAALAFHAGAPVNR